MHPHHSADLAHDHVGVQLSTQPVRHLLRTLWRLRDLGAVARCAAGHGLALTRVEEMPSNNLSLIFRKVIAVSPGGAGVP